jgi:hypothetical protein
LESNNVTVSSDQHNKDEKNISHWLKNNL